MSGVKIYDGEKFVPFNISNAIEMPVGFEDYVSYTELDPRQLIRNGQLVSREIYSDLWNFVQSKPSMLLTEEEWQANLTTNEGLACNYYSAGDGSTNFRLPKASVIVLPDPNFAPIKNGDITNFGVNETKPKTITKLPIVYA